MSLRNGIRHFRDVDHGELQTWLCPNGFIDCSVTEKTDGMAFAIGWCDDYQRLYTRTSYSPRTYRAEEYRERAVKKFGDNFNPAISATFMEAHKLLMANEHLTRYVKEHNTEISGEMFLRSAGETDELGRIKFVGTWYDLEKIPAQGTFVIHRMVNEKPPVDGGTWTSRYLKIDHDVVDVEDDYRPMLRGMTVEEAEVAVRNWLSVLVGKWGDEKEGYVLHRRGLLPIKLMNDSFYANKRKF